MGKSTRWSHYRPDRGEDRDPLERLWRYVCFGVGVIAAVLCFLIGAAALVGMVRLGRYARR